MELNQIVTGKITGIKPYGLFIKTETYSMFCHISNISHLYVDINKFNIGDEVTAQIIEIDEEKNRINVSMKVLEIPDNKPKDKPKVEAKVCHQEKSESKSFEDMLQDFLKNSDDKMNSINRRYKKRGIKNK